MPEQPMGPPTGWRGLRWVAGVAVLAGAVAAGCSDSGGGHASPSSGDEGEAPPPTTAGAYGEGWSAVHADAANTDYAAVDGPPDVSLAWERSFDGTINLGATVGPGGRVHVTSTSPGCHLHVLDAATGDTVWCSDEVDRLAVISSPLLDRDGRIYLADSAAMHAFGPEGDLLWETPIEGVPLSAQFTPGGRVVFVTNIGRVYMLDRDTGEAAAEPLELIPGATFDPAGGVMACAMGTAECPSANTPAVDLESGRLVFTFWEPGAAAAGVRALRIDEGDTTTITPAWTNESLPGGSASSPVLSGDGSRVYLNDNAGNLHALDAATGQAIWQLPLGYATGGSPSLSPSGLIMPAGGARGAVVAVADRGDRGEVVWRREAWLNRGVATQAGGGRAYLTVDAGDRHNDLVVVDTATGDALDREPLPGVTGFTVGTTLGPDGTVYVPTIRGQLFAFRPGAERRGTGS
ncbi:MAG TPA: PQQ-binding-like beta-propeller repeat protein [Acidimicrobiales bacterium]